MPTNPPSRRSPTLPILWLTVLVSYGAPAGVSAEESPIILFDDTAVSALEDRWVEDVARRLGLPSTDALTARPATEFAFGGAAVWPHGIEVTSSTGGDSILRLHRIIAWGEAAIVLVDYEETIAQLSVVTERLADVQDPLDGPALARAAFLLGYAHYQSGDEPAAVAAFAQAAVFDPGVRWDNDFPPEPQQTFNNAILEALRRPDARLELADPETAAGAESPIALDGAPIALPATVPPGLHRITLPGSDGLPRLIAVDLPQGETIQLVPVDQLVRGWFGPPREAGTAAIALADALARVDATEAYVVDPVSDRIVLVRPGAGQVMEIARTPQATKPLKREGRGASPGAPIAIAGGVVAGIGLAMGLAQRSHALSILADTDACATDRDRRSEDYHRASGQMTAGFVIAGIGGAAVVVGIPIGIHHGRKAQDRGASVSVWWTPGPSTTADAGFRLSGRW